MTEEERFTFNIGPSDRLFWVLEKLEWAASHLEAAGAPIEERLERALLEMVPVQPTDLPDDLREKLAPIRHAAMHEILPEMTTEETQAIGQAILGLRDEVQRRIDIDGRESC
jgi:hypothetical protein